MSSPIYVAQPDLPPLEEFLPYLEKIWETKKLTNGGDFHQQLEKELGRYLGVEHLSLCTNGTIGLIIAMQALGVYGEVITSPYSFVATAHSLLWNGIQPVFVDIDPFSPNIDASRIEEAITERTSAILAVHCYGMSCDVDAIQAIAEKYGLKVIYDAAHAFGVKDAGGSILRHGDLSVLSFHATKVFHTFEGGAIISPDLETKYHVDCLKNFGFLNETTVIEAGINGKMSEVNAAFGLLQLRYIDSALAKRRKLDIAYRSALGDKRGIRCLYAQDYGNNAYFPIFVENDYPITRDELYEKLRRLDIYARRYFYPLITDFPMYKNFLSARIDNIPNAKRFADKVLCLPMYSELSIETVDDIADIICSV